MDGKSSFILYTEIADVIKELTNEQKGVLFQAILDYQLGNEIMISDSIVRIAFIPIKQNLDRNAEKWERIRLKRSEAGKKGMAKRWSDNKPITNDNKAITNDNNDITKITVNVNDNVNANANVNGNVNVNVNEKSKGKTQAFCPPSLDEVKDYCWERKNNVDAQAFIDFYTSKGWMIGKSKMKDWKAAVRTWERRDTDKVTPIRDNKAEVDDFFRRELGV